MFETIERFRAKMNRGELCLGAGITLSDSAIVEALAPLVDFFWIDLEHTHLSYETVLQHLIAARAGDVPGLVRVRGSDVPHIKPVLDIGASGIIVPQVRSVDEVRGVVNACRYAPLGNRGFGPRRAADYGRLAGAPWLQRSNRELFVAVQIENAAALAVVEEIAALEGLDSLALGPYDLSISLGHAGDVQHPDVASAIERIVRAARDHGKFIGSGMGAYAGEAMIAAGRGVQWIQCGDDYGYMLAQLEQLFAGIRNRSVSALPVEENA